MLNDTPKLYIFSGLPATGKTTLAKRLANYLAIAYLRIDTIEQGLRDLCTIDVEGEGYRLSYRIAQDNLSNGVSIIADSCNPISLTRNEWNQVAIDSGATFINIEVICSIKSEHLKRVNNRVSDIPNIKLPTWHEIQNRQYDKWDNNQRIIVDTSEKSAEESFKQLLTLLTP